MPLVSDDACDIWARIAACDAVALSAVPVGELLHANRWILQIGSHSGGEYAFFWYSMLPA